jgi:hypothetical protein
VSSALRSTRVSVDHRLLREDRAALPVNGHARVATESKPMARAPSTLRSAASREGQPCGHEKARLTPSLTTPGACKTIEFRARRSCASSLPVGSPC